MIHGKIGDPANESPERARSSAVGLLTAAEMSCAVVLPTSTARALPDSVNNLYSNRTRSSTLIHSRRSSRSVLDGVVDDVGVCEVMVNAISCSSEYATTAAGS